MTKRTADEIGLLRSIASTQGMRLSGAPPEILNNLVHEGLLTWHWYDRVPVYELTSAGHGALASGERPSASNQTNKNGT